MLIFDTTTIYLFINIVFLLLLGIISFKCKNKLLSFITIIIQISIICSLFIIREYQYVPDIVTYLDYFNYYYKWSDIYTGYYAWKGDYLFFFVGWLIKQISTNVDFYLFAYNFIILAISCYGIYLLNGKKIIIIPITLGIYSCSSSFYFLYGNILRQSGAIAFLYITYYYLIKKQYIRMLFCLLISLLFHKSSAIFLPVIIIYIILKKDVKKRYLIGLLLFTWVGYKTLLLLNLPYLTEKMKIYSEREYSIANIIGKIAIIIILIFIYNKIEKKYYIEKADVKIKKIIYAYMICIIPFIDILKIASRIIIMINVIIPVLFCIPLIYMKREKINEYLKILCIVTLIYGLFVASYESIHKVMIF